MEETDNYGMNMQNDVEKQDIDVSKPQKCPACGGTLVWSAEEKTLVCEHCGTKVEIDLVKFKEELDFAEMLSGNNDWTGEMKVLKCNGCGNNSLIAKGDTIGACPFCGSENMVEVEDSAGIKPNAVIPFALTKDEAVDKIKSWAKKRILAPKAFKLAVSPNGLNGNYTPCYSYDTNILSHYTFEAGRYYKVPFLYIFHKKKVKYATAKDVYRARYNETLIQASNNVTQKVIDKLQPFDTQLCNVYSSELMHGFTASKYVIKGNECWESAQEKIKERAKEDILKQYTFDKQKNFKQEASFNNVKFKYLLLPLYIGNYKWKDKVYNFYVNGRTGKVTGKTPLAPFKATLAGIIATILGAAALGVAGFAIYFLLTILHVI